jgi:hypothetical protein
VVVKEGMIILLVAACQVGAYVVGNRLSGGCRAAVTVKKSKSRRVRIIQQKNAHLALGKPKSIAIFERSLMVMARFSYESTERVSICALKTEAAGHAPLKARSDRWQATPCCSRRPDEAWRLAKERRVGILAL